MTVAQPESDTEYRSDYFAPGETIPGDIFDHFPSPEFP
jgi:hypothetical protein